jgi:hypothetical protein
MVQHAHAFWSWFLAAAVVAVAPGNACTPVEPPVGVAAVTNPPEDAGAEAGSVVEGGEEDASYGRPDANACAPGDVETYRPTSYHFASAAWQGACRPGSSDSDPIDDFYDACIRPEATKTSCDAFKSDPANAECARCILTSASATHYGPLVDQGTFVTANVAGCIELTDPNGISCAKSVQALGGCEIAACEANCPVQDQDSRSAYDTCASQADRTGCQSYAKAAGCLTSEADAGDAAKCLIASFVDFYKAVVPLFCGEPPAGLEGGVLLVFDASSVASPEASGDGASEAHASSPSDALGATDAEDAGALSDAAKD